MTTLFRILIFLLLAKNGYAQHEPLVLGKRKNVVWSREIKPDNLGSIYTYYYPIYFKTTGSSGFNKTGTLGRQIEPQLNMNSPEVRREFRNFKMNKKLSYVLLTGAVASLVGWTYSSANYMFRTDDYRMGAFFEPERLPLLAGYFIGFSGSIYLNLKGDKNLKRAVKWHNKSIRFQ